MKPFTIKIVKLENGLTLKIFDASRKLAGDRWLVSVVAEVEISLDRVDFPLGESELLGRNDVTNALGRQTVFSQKRQRIFIAESRKDETRQALCDSITNSLLAYISREDFAQKFILSEYRKHRQHIPGMDSKKNASK